MTLRLRNGVSTAEVDYGTALLDQDHGQYWNLNPTGALILQTLLGGGTPAQAAQALTEQHAVDFETASFDVAQLVDELRSAGLVEDEAGGSR